VEQYFQYKKAKYFGDNVLAQQILDCKNPMDALRMGLEITIPVDRQTPENEEKWVIASLQIMEKGLRAKVISRLSRLFPTPRPHPGVFGGPPPPPPLFD
jgi:predicted NAD-dependent protein-ADP-ribosyltransferase YbiA (DUF1768 family)